MGKSYFAKLRIFRTVSKITNQESELTDDVETFELQRLEQVFLTQYRPLMQKQDGTVRVI